MSTIKTMTFEEIKNYRLTEKDRKNLTEFKTSDYSDCPRLTKEELAEFRPWYEIHPEWAEFSN